jgi:hypothetical protein
MNQILKVIAWIVGGISAIVLFSEPTAEIFPIQMLSAIILCGIFWIIRRKGVTNEA